MSERKWESFFLVLYFSIDQVLRLYSCFITKFLSFLFFVFCGFFWDAILKLHTNALFHLLIRPSIRAWRLGKVHDTNERFWITFNYYNVKHVPHSTRGWYSGPTRGQISLNFRLPQTLPWLEKIRHLNFGGFPMFGTPSWNDRSHYFHVR
jgi:hypothetical protein